MTFETLKKSHLKRNILIAVVVVAIISAVILNFTRAKYRVTQSIPFIQGTINFSPSDLNLMAVYLNKNGETISSDKVPHVGYTLNEEESLCEVNDFKDEKIQIVYENGLLNFNGLGNKGTKCTAYFDLIPDSENPVLNSINTSSLDDTSVTIEVNATDNIGIYYYYYQLDDNEEIQSIYSTYTFNGLEKDSVHTITVRVEDAAGNVSGTQSKEITVGLRAGDVILAHYPTVLTRTSFSSTVTTTTTGTIYKSANANQYDDYGETYYFAGNPTDNWVQFGTNSSGQALYWRIIRINGDGSVRLIYNGTSTVQIVYSTMINANQTFNSSYNNNMYVGYMYTSGQVHGTGTNSTILNTLNTWYQNNLADEADYIDGNAGFCGDRTPSTSSSSSNGSGGTEYTTTYYGAHIRLVNSKNPSYKCTDKQDLYTTSGSSTGNGALQYPIGLITVDEVAYAGGVFGSNNSNSSYYLYNNANYWTMSPYSFHANYARVFYVGSDGCLDYNGVTHTLGVRPVINLKSAIAITGSGTTGDPFKIQ